MGNRYTKRLKVSDPNGVPVYAIIRPGLNTSNVEVRYLEVVAKDNPPFANNGVIRFNVSKGKFKNAIQALTNYIETLYLKELDKGIVINEDIYTSIGIERTKSGGNKSSIKQRGTRTFKGERDVTGLHNSARGSDDAESTVSGKEKRKSNNDLAESCDPQTSAEDTSGD